MQTEKKAEFGSNLARLRRDRKWSQRDLAEKLHTDHAMVTRWEKGKVIPRLDTIARLAAIFEVSEEELLGQHDQALEPSSPRLRDPEFIQLLSQIDQLDSRDREALKAVLEAMLTRSKLRAMVESPGKQQFGT